MHSLHLSIDFVNVPLIDRVMVIRGGASFGGTPISILIARLILGGSQRIVRFVLLVVGWLGGCVSIGDTKNKSLFSRGSVWTV